MLDIFYTTKYDSNVLIKNNDKNYSVFEIKNLIKSKVVKLKDESENIILLKDDNFSFIINFFASIFADKNIYLIDSKQKLNNIKFDYFIADDDFKNNNTDFEFSEIDKNKININFYTSGTTSTPKLIKKSLYNLIQEAKDIKDEFKIKENNLEFITTTILQHLFGITFFLMFPLINIEKKFIINTNKILYPDNIDVKNSVLVSTPSFLDSIKKYDTNFIEKPKYIISAGSKLNLETFKYLEEKSNIIEIYGSSETGVMAHKEKSDSNLFLFKNVEIELKDNKTIVKSSYFPEDEIEINDELELKDRVVIFKTRKDKVFKIYDKRINADEIEEIIVKNDFIENAYCFKNDEKLAIMCALSNLGKNKITQIGVNQFKKELKSYLKKYFEIIPQKWKFIDVLPINSRGKINTQIIDKIFNINFSFPVILVRKKEENEIIYKLFLYKNSNYFKGHFPSFEITPGVVQLYLAKFLGEYSFDVSFDIFKIKKIKFSNIIKENSIVNLKLIKSPNQIKFEYIDDNNVYSSGSFPTENGIEI